MHERRLARAVLREVLALAGAHCAGRALAARVEVGPLSGVEPELLVSALGELASGTLAAETRWTVRMVPLVVRCGGCRREYTAADVRLTCPACGSPRGEVLRGDGLVLESVDFDVAESSTASAP